MPGTGERRVRISGRPGTPTLRPASRDGPTAAQALLDKTCDLESRERLPDRGLSRQDLEGLVVGVLAVERDGEGTGNVFAGDLTPPPELFGHLYPARARILGQAAGTDDGVVEPAALETLVGAGLGAEVGAHRLG